MIKLRIDYKPKWYQFRKQLCRFFMYLAEKADPGGPYVWTKKLEDSLREHYKRHMHTMMTEAMIYGTGSRLYDASTDKVGE